MVRPRQFTDDQILDSARRCLLEQGPGASTATIARAVGMSQAALFKRFGSKEELVIAALMPRQIPTWIGDLADGPDDRDIREQLLEIAGKIEAFFLEFGPCMSILRASKISEQQVIEKFPGAPPPVLAQRALSGWFQRARDAGRIRDIDTDAVALMLLGSLIVRMFFNFILGQQFEFMDLDGRDRDGSRESSYVSIIVESLWRGISPAPP